MTNLIENVGRHVLLLLVLTFICGCLVGITGSKRFFYWRMDQAKQLERMIYKGDIYTFVIDASRVPANVKVK